MNILPHIFARTFPQHRNFSLCETYINRLEYKTNALYIKKRFIESFGWCPWNQEAKQMIFLCVLSLFFSSSLDLWTSVNSRGKRNYSAIIYNMNRHFYGSGIFQFCALEAFVIVFFAHSTTNWCFIILALRISIVMNVNISENMLTLSIRWYTQVIHSSTKNR